MKKEKGGFGLCARMILWLGSTLVVSSVVLYLVIFAKTSENIKEGAPGKSRAYAKLAAESVQGELNSEIDTVRGISAHLESARSNDFPINSAQLATLLQTQLLKNDSA